jgi:hypothetical protein
MSEKNEIKEVISQPVEDTEEKQEKTVEDKIEAVEVEKEEIQSKEIIDPSTQEIPQEENISKEEKISDGEEKNNGDEQNDKNKKSSPDEDIFITEEDTFNIELNWYKDGGKIFVDGEDVEYDPDFEDIRTLGMTFKFPSQGDYEIIMGSATYKSPDDVNVSDIIQMEITRMVTLVRAWTLDQKLERMVELDPNIIKGALRKIRNVIGMKGIL